MQEVACIDDSDCTQLGHKFVCHLYKCINWVEQTPCSLSSPCHQQEEQEEECQRVSNLYEDQTEICLPRRRPCSAHSDCGDERERCCRDSCCPTQFYRAWTQFRSDLVSLSLVSQAGPTLCRGLFRVASDLMPYSSHPKPFKASMHGKVLL